MSDIAIKVENLSKYYRLGVINNGALFKDLQSWWAIRHGKEDPHGKIGEHRFDNTEDGFWALKDLNFEIRQGDRVGIIGHNGAGKSTLLKVLSRITAPTEGDVKIKGRIASLLEVGTGFHPELTGRENIYLNGAILGMKRREIDRKIDEIIAFSEIEKHIDTPVKRYSSGMYVRLAFAVAAHLDSEILIADEVLAVGDAAFQKKALGKMNELSTGQGRTVLFVSHNMKAVKELCNKGIVLDKGRSICNGTIFDAEKTYLYDSVNIEGEDISLVNDYKVKRNSGWVHFKTARFDKSVYTSTEDILFNSNVFVNKKTEGLYFSLVFRNSFGENLTQVRFEISNAMIDEGTSYKIRIKIPSGELKPGEYHIYLWLGDKKALSQSNPENFEVLEDLIAPIFIERSENDTNYAYFDIKSSLEVETC